jgi:hypothetical protein
MKYLILAITLVLCGCDTISGVSRSAAIQKLPDLQRVKVHIEGYPEIEGVRFWEREGGRPLTLTGIKKADEVYYLSYWGGDNIRGTLMFEKNYKGQVTYSQTLTMLNFRVPQAWIDATWPVMKKIEQDLEVDFGCPEIQETLKVGMFRVRNPERKEPNKAATGMNSRQLTNGS